MPLRIAGERLLAVISLIICLVTLYCKRPDSFVHAQFWGEEGTVFFSDAYHHGFKSVFNTCAGYFHLYPRLVFCVALILGLPMETMPFISSYSWFLVFVLLLFYVWKRVKLGPLQKFFVSISMVLIPIQSEVLMNLTNVQWIFAVFPVIIFAYPSTSKKWWWLDVTVLFITGFTGPNLLIFIPLVLYLLVSKKIDLTERRTRVLTAVLFISAIATVLSLYTFGTIDRTKGTFDLSNPALINYVFVQYALLFLSKFAFDTPLPLMYAAVGIILTFIFYYSVRIFRGREQDRFRIITFFGSVIFMVTTLISYRHVPSTLHPHYGAARNFFLPALFCVWFVLSFLTFGTRNNIIASVFMLILLIDNFRVVAPVRTAVPTWNDYAPMIRTVDAVSIPIDPPGWYISIDNRDK